MRARRAALRVRIDGHGLALSSRSRLTHIAAAERRLDRSLIADMATKARDRPIVKFVIDRAHGVHVSMLEAGIEGGAFVAMRAAIRYECFGAGVFRGGCDLAPFADAPRRLSALTLLADAPGRRLRAAGGRV